MGAKGNSTGKRVGSLLTLLTSGGDSGPTPAAGAISQWVVDDLTVGTSNTELWTNRVLDKPSLQRGDGIGKTRVVEVDAAFNDHQVVNNTHASGNREAEWCDGSLVESTAKSFTICFVCNIDGYDSGASSSMFSAYDTVGVANKILFRSTRTPWSTQWGHIYTGINPAWDQVASITSMDAGNTHVYTLVLDSAANAYIYVDNTLIRTYLARWTGGDDLGDSLGIFGYYNTGGILFGLYGRFAECRIYNEVFSDGDRNVIVDELKTTYGIT